MASLWAAGTALCMAGLIVGGADYGVASLIGMTALSGVIGLHMPASHRTSNLYLPASSFYLYLPASSF